MKLNDRVTLQNANPWQEVMTSFHSPCKRYFFPNRVGITDLTLPVLSDALCCAQLSQVKEMELSLRLFSWQLVMENVMYNSLSVNFRVS